MWWEFYPKSKPRAAKGGIKAQNKRGAFGKSWWAKRWIEVLESFNIGARLGRGKTYARKGQVLSVDVEEGTIKAKVQGSQATPYKVRIEVKTLSNAEWQRLIKALSEQAIFAAKLLAGEMPQDIEKVFQQAKLSLFPSKYKDLTTDCSCPDWSNPCKHIAAVYYLLGEEFDRDPFLIFKLRGLSREDLIKQLGGAKKAGQSKADSAGLPPEPLPADAAAFWSGNELPADFFAEVQTAPVHAALPKRLGNFPFWRGQEQFLESLEKIYEDAAHRGLEIYTTAGAKNGEQG